MRPKPAPAKVKVTAQNSQPSLPLCNQPYLQWKSPLRIPLIAQQNHSRPIQNNGTNAPSTRYQLFEMVIEVQSNDPSSATRHAGRNDCKPRRHAGFAAAHG